MMHCLMMFLTYLLVLTTYSKIAVEAVDIYSIRDDIDEFNVTCIEDSCEHHETDSLSSRSCHCGIQCIPLGTCCVDSDYIGIEPPKLKPSCRSVHQGGSYYMVDECPFTDSAWAALCNDEWNGEDDVQKLMPVTSRLTSITYKNYYCFRCHEVNDDFLYWVVQIQNDVANIESSDLSLTHCKENNTWMAISDKNIGYFPVSLTIRVPSEIMRLAHSCETDVITDCSLKWTDEKVKNKCQSYMALKEVQKDFISLKYKNIHCALCNFESLNDIHCREPIYAIFDFKPTFSFTYLLDINLSDGELVGKTQQCSENYIWDPYTKRCRQLTCALPGFKVKNGKCVQ